MHKRDANRQVIPFKNIIIQLLILCSFFGVMCGNVFAEGCYADENYNSETQQCEPKCSPIQGRNMAWHPGLNKCKFTEGYTQYKNGSLNSCWTTTYEDMPNDKGHWIGPVGCGKDPEEACDIWGSLWSNAYPDAGYYTAFNTESAQDNSACNYPYRHICKLYDGSDALQPYNKEIVVKYEFLSCPEGQWIDKNRFCGCGPICPEGKTYYRGECISSEYYIEPESQNPEQCRHGKSNPIDPRTENKFQVETDFSSNTKLPLRITRHYNSTGSGTGQSELGASWRHNYMSEIDSPFFDNKPEIKIPGPKSTIFSTPDGACESGWQQVKAKAFKGAYIDATAVYEDYQCKIQIDEITVATIPVKSNTAQTFIAYREIKNQFIKEITRPNGAIFTFKKSGQSWQPTIDKDIKLEQLEGGGWKFTDANGTVELFNSEGKLTSITNIAGFSQTLIYDEAGKLDYVEDDNGNRLTFAYNAQNKISSVTLPDNTLINYEYDAEEKLTKVIYQDDTPDDLSDNPTKEYLYENETFPYALTGIMDEKGVRYSTFDYDSEGRASLTQHQNNADKYSFVYNPDGSTTITNALGKQTTYTYTAINGQVKIETVTGHPTQMCGGTNKNYTYDDYGYIATKTDWNGNITSYVRNATGRILEKTIAVGTTDAMTTAYQYHPTLKLKTQIDMHQGEDTTTPAIKSTTIIYYGDETGEEYWKGLVKSRTVTDPNTGESRTTSYTYYDEGELGARQLKTVDGPREDVQDITTYTYDANGNLLSTENALGHTSHIYEYDGAGRPLTIHDANQVETVLTYTPRGWLSTSRTNGGDTQYIYDNVGNVTDIIAPDGSTISYTYDDAYRLTDITDKHGNSVHYELNAMGGVVKQEIKDPSGTLSMVRTTLRDELNRIKHSIGANVEEDIETNYDDNGNIDNTVDAYQRVTDNSFDALNRITQTTDAAQGITTTRYDIYGNVSEVEDPRGLITKYTYNALGDLKELISPDTGTTTYIHDSAGNITSQTDANNITVTYAYDTLNRLTGVTYPDSSENIHYGYDATSFAGQDNNFGIGRLTSISDQSGTIEYKYNSNGLVSDEIRTITGTAYTFGYQYNLADKLTHITYPSGMLVEYIRDDAGKIVGVTAKQDDHITTLADSISYKPFGPIQTIQFGNGYIQTNSYNLNYQLESINTPNVLNLDYAYDYMGNITGMQDMLDSLFDQDYSLDNLYRLDTAAGEYGVIDYDLDATGNRIALTEDGFQTSYTVDPTSNRIDNIGDISFGYDATGNTTSKSTAEANWTYAYNQNGRLKTVTKDGIQVAQYIYNALGQRTQKTTDAGTTTQIINSAAQLLVENSDATTKEYIYLGGQVLASYTTAENAEPIPEPGPCPETKSTNSQHESAGRAYSESETTGQTCFGSFCFGGTTTTTWYATGSGENLGTSGSAEIALFENGTGYWQTANPNNCIQLPTGPCESVTSTNQEHTQNSRAYTTTQTVGGTCWGSFCWGGTEQTVYKAQGSDDDLGTESTTQTTLFADPNGNYYLNDPETCPVEIENPHYQGWAYYHNDHLGTPRVVTDANGNELWKGNYNPFGKVKETAPEGVVFQQDIRFPGQVEDAETGLYYNYFRYYDPSLGRYITSDPIGLNGGLNTYAYVAGNPTIYVDPLGLEIRRYRSPAFGNPNFVHVFVWSTELEKGKGTVGSSFMENAGDGTNSLDYPYDIVELPDGMTEKEFMDEIDKFDGWNNYLYFPFINDCHADLEGAFEHAGVDYPPAPEGRIRYDDIIRDKINDGTRSFWDKASDFDYWYDGLVGGF